MCIRPNPNQNLSHPKHYPTPVSAYQPQPLSPRGEECGWGSTNQN